MTNILIIQNLAHGSLNEVWQPPESQYISEPSTSSNHSLRSDCEGRYKNYKTVLCNELDTMLVGFALAGREDAD